MSDKRIVLRVMLSGVAWVWFTAMAGGEVVAEPTVLAPLPLLQDTMPDSRQSVDGKSPSFAGATGWINSPPLTAAKQLAPPVDAAVGPEVAGRPVRFRVLIDGKPPGAAHGIDVDEQGHGTVIEHRLYQLVRQAGPVKDRRFEIEFLDPAVEVFSFTFG